MSLVNCRECNSEVSDTAETCPKCGVSIPSQARLDAIHAAVVEDRKFKKWAWVIGIVLGLYIVFGGPLEKGIKDIQKGIEDFQRTTQK